MSTPPAVKRWWVTNLRGAAGAGAAFSAPLSPGGLSPLGASSARTAAVVETNRVKRMASIALRMRRISLMVNQIRLERAEVSGWWRAAGGAGAPGWGEVPSRSLKKSLAPVQRGAQSGTGIGTPAA